MEVDIVHNPMIKKIRALSISLSILQYIMGFTPVNFIYINYTFDFFCSA